MLLACCHTQAQPVSFEQLIKQFDTYRQQHLQEKIHVHTDRPNYLTGETMWFKVYLTDGTLHRPLDISRVTYLELLDETNAPVAQAKISMRDGIGDGSIYLSPGIRSGNYTLRAYTNWMKNYSPEFFFHRTITIINTFRPLELPEVKPPVVDLQFFPEGGNLVGELKSRVAYRATGADGKGIHFSGVIRNARMDTLLHIQPEHHGMGTFELIPEKGETYHAVIQTAADVVSEHLLPEVQESGWVMTLNEESDQLILSVNAPAGGNRQLPIHVFVHARNMIIAKTSGTFSSGVYTYAIPKASMAEGITHITVFDDQLQPRCERLYFRQPKVLLQLRVTPAEEGVYNTRSKVALNVSAASSNEQSLPAHLSVSVYAADSLPVADDGNIITSFWLTSDLVGNVENPHYYFSADTPEVRAAADLLMLTHGWRRFRWDDVKQDNVQTPYVPEYRGLILKGKVTNIDGTPARNIMTYLSTPGKLLRLYTSLSNDTGDVIYEVQKYYGTSRIHVQTNRLRDSTYRITLNSPWASTYASRTLRHFTLTKNFQSTLLSRSVAMQVQDIYVEEALDESSRNIVNASTFYGLADERYALDDYTRFPVMEEVMREYVKGVWVRKRKDGFHYMVMDNINKQVFDDPPLMLIDGVPFFDADEIMAFDPRKVQVPDVMTRRYYLGPASFPGVVSYRTYTGDLNGFVLHPSVTTLDFEGLQRQREFYSPRYDNVSQRRSRLPDQRTLLYWNPSVTTDASGRATIEFYTSDVTGQFHIKLEGINYHGAVGTGHSPLIVK
jgi:hypothetical protein